MVCWEIYTGYRDFAWLLAFTQSSQKISTHLLTVLTTRVILRTEQRKWIIKITRILINKVRSPLKGDMTYVKTKYFYRQFTG